jgi:hypothetical protein
MHFHYLVVHHISTEQQYLIRSVLHFVSTSNVPKDINSRWLNVSNGKTVKATIEELLNRIIYKWPAFVNEKSHRSTGLSYTHQIQWATHAIFHQVATGIAHGAYLEQREIYVTSIIQFHKILPIFLTFTLNNWNSRNLSTNFISVTFVLGFCSITSMNSLLSAQHGASYGREGNDFHTLRTAENILNKNSREQPISGSPAASEQAWG